MIVIALRVNGELHQLAVEPAETLLDVLRERLHLTGTKRGCDTGDCGACTVLLDGKPVNACLVLAAEADGCSVQTVEGIRHPVQDRFVRYGSFQCGYCAPGFVVSSYALLQKKPRPTVKDITRHLSGHLCRCTGYVRIVKALLNEKEELEEKNGLDVVGRPVPRKDIWQKVTGQAKFTADLYFPGLVYGALVLSPYPHARIRSIDFSDAVQMEGVLLVLTGKDVPQVPYGVSPARYDETILPDRVVRHVGEPVAAVFAANPRLAQEAAEKVKVDYEPLPAVFDPEEALREGAPQAHEAYRRNVNTEIHQDFGEIDKVFEEADYVREDEFSGQRTHQAYLEPPASLAVVEGDLINLWTATQTPHYVQYQVSRVLGIPMSQLRVIKPAMGGGFGGKAEATKLDFLTVLAARRLNRPVLMVMDRKQVFFHGRGRHAQKIRLKTAFTKEGRILGTHVQTRLDGGAYTGYGIITAYYSGCLLTTPYRMPHFRFDSFRVCTNLPACGAQRGNGTPQPRFAFESHLDLAAKDLGLRPDEIRRRNLIEAGHRTVNDLQITSCGMHECLERVVEISRFREKYGKLPFGEGIGLGLGCFISGAAYPIVRGDTPHSSCVIRISEDGQRAFLYTGAPDIGQGSDTVLCQIVAEALGLAYEQVSIISADTALTPADLGAYASRITFMAGNAALAAAEDIKSKLAEFCRRHYGIVAGKLQFRKGTLSDGKHQFEFSQLAREFFQREGPLVGKGMYNPPKLGGTFKGAAVGPSPAYSFCAAAVEVWVDAETGRVRVKDVYVAHDSGTVINPATFQGQVEGAIVMGLGEALYEEIHHQQGNLLNPNFHDYVLPTVADIPRIRTVTVPVKDPSGPFGAKEVGEGTILPIMGAIANAVEDAVGVRIKSLPITAEKVLTALKEKHGT
jgi:4-hydroxybenzoyl-CoA reductase subunit alpha